MKRIISIAGCVLLLACQKNDNSMPSQTNGNFPRKANCNYDKQQLYKDQQGNCFYYNGSGRKEYVEKEKCDC